MAHPIESLMETTMNNIRSMVDVNTIIGDPVETPTGTVIIPISRVSFGFSAGGGEYSTTQNTQDKNSDNNGKPFAGGSGAGVSLRPVAFLIVGPNETRLLPVDSSMFAERILEMAPKLVSRLQEFFEDKKDEKQKG